MELPSEVNTRWLLPLVAVSENDSINIDKRDYTLLINDVMTLLAGFKKLERKSSIMIIHLAHLSLQYLLAYWK